MPRFVLTANRILLMLAVAAAIGAPAARADGRFEGASDDGTHVFFTTDAPLVSSDTDDLTDVYERSGGATTLVSAPGVGAAGPAAPAITGGVVNSADGSRVFFVTAERLVAADTDSRR